MQYCNISYHLGMFSWSKSEQIWVLQRKSNKRRSHDCGGNYKKLRHADDSGQKKAEQLKGSIRQFRLKMEE
eukprot:Em0096g3a